MLFTQSVLSQSVGYEMRTNDKSYIAITYKGIELRHRTDDLENRFTYRVGWDTSNTFRFRLKYKF